MSRPAGPRRAIAPIAAALRRPQLAPLLIVGFLAVAGFAAFEVTFAQFVHARLAISHRQVSFLFAYVGVLAVIVQGTLVGALTRRLGERRMVLAGLSLTAAALLLLASAHRLAVILGALPLLTLGTGVTAPSLSALVSHGAAADEQGMALGAYQGVGSLARVAGPFLAQLALGHLGVASPAVAAAVLTLLAAWSLVAWQRRSGPLYGEAVPRRPSPRRVPGEEDP